MNSEIDNNKESSYLKLSDDFDQLRHGFDGIEKAIISPVDSIPDIAKSHRTEKKMKYNKHIHTDSKKRRGIRYAPTAPLLLSVM